MSTNSPGRPVEVDLLVRNAYVMTVDVERRVFVDGAVAVKGNSIVAVGRGREVTPAVEAARTIHAHGAVVHPGFIDGHVHLLYHNIRWAYEDGAGWDDAIPIHRAYGGLADDEIVVEKGQSTRVDEEELFALSRETSGMLLERLDRRPPQGRWPQVV